MADLKVDKSTTTTATTDATPPAEAEPAKATTTAPKDSAETASDDGVPTKDEKSKASSWLGKITGGAAKASTAVWEHAAKAQKHINKRAKEEREKPQDFFEEAGAKAGLKPTDIRAARAEAAAGEHEEHGLAETVDHSVHVAHLGLHTAHVTDTAQSVVRNANAIRNAGSYKGAVDVVKHGELTHGTVGGSIMKWGGRAVFAYDAGKNAALVYNDLTDGNGLSIDSLQPIADTAASAIGTFGGPVGTAFKVGYDLGGYIDDKLGIGDAIDAAHDRHITQHTQIGFLCDRAREMDLGAVARIQSGTQTRRDELRVRSIVREAREHGILRADGTVDRKALMSQIDRGGWENERRVAHGIERAAWVEKQWNAGER